MILSSVHRLSSWCQNDMTVPTGMIHQCEWDHHHHYSFFIAHSTHQKHIMLYALYKCNPPPRKNPITSRFIHLRLGDWHRVSIKETYVPWNSIQVKLHNQCHFYSILKVCKNVKIWITSEFYPLTKRMFCQVWIYIQWGQNSVVGALSWL